MKKMTYKVEVAKLFFRREDSFFQIREAERLTGLWKRILWFLVLSMLVFGFTAWKGLGMEPLSWQATDWSFATYESMKFFFLTGRLIYALLFSIVILFFTPFIYWIFTGIPYRKLIIVQLNVLFLMLIERLLWVGFVQYAGLDWFLSPLSFGIIAALITDHVWTIYLFGAISLVQIWAMWFQTKALVDFSSIKKWKMSILVIFLHLFYWAASATLAYYDLYLF